MNQATTQTTLPLPGGTSLVQNQKYYSQSGGHYLVFQTDGNLVVFQKTDDKKVWGLDNVVSPSVNFSSARRVDMQNDGNLVIYDASGNHLWSALQQVKDSRDCRTHLVLTPQGALQLVWTGRKVLWSSDGKLVGDPDPLMLVTLHADCKSCREGLDQLSKNMYSGKGDETRWIEVWNDFMTDYLPACIRVGNFTKKYRGDLVLYQVEKVMTVWLKNVPTWDSTWDVNAQTGGMVGWDVYFDGKYGISTHGSRIGTITDTTLYDPTLGVQRIQKSISGVKTILDLLDKIEGLPDYGWVHCRTLETPKIAIMGSKAVSSSAMDVIKHIYTEMTKRFTSSYPLNKLDDYVIYVTNGEPWSELSSLAPIGTSPWTVDAKGLNKGDDQRGGEFDTLKYLWIDEQMICKTGVRTRNEAFAAGIRLTPDNDVRTFDQVIHEFGHAIANMYGLKDRIKIVYNGSSDACLFPWSIQYWFGSPSGDLTPSESAFMNEIFSSRTTFPTTLYTPGA